jgi:N6-adenosine-specific RNA methylase IME4
MATAHADVTAAQVNGTWRKGKNEFKILALGQQKLQIAFSGVWEHKTGDGERTANTGEGSGTARIEGDTAIFKPDGAEDECKITLKFTNGKLIVAQNGICGFGFNVTAEGTYKKISSKKPTFDSE